MSRSILSTVIGTRLLSFKKNAKELFAGKIILESTTISMYFIY